MFSRRPKIPIDWERIEASAPGRFVLIGEFGDLDDRNAIGVALDRRLKVTIRPHKEGCIRLNLNDFKNVREWPTSAPVLTMTKLVANYADTLTYSESLQQTLKPLLQQKYYKTTLNVQQHSQATTSTRDDATNSSSNNVDAVGDQPKLSPAGSTLQTLTDDDDEEAGAERAPVDKPVVDQDPTNSEQEPPLFQEVRNLSTRVLDPVAQTDSTVIAFFMLYLALGDSYAGSLRPSLDVEVESEIPMCRGLGSSTALGVALCGALMKVFRISAEPSVIIEWALCVDKFYHTHVTGLHSSVVTTGGYIYYQNNRIKSVGTRHPESLSVLLIDSGIRRHPNEVTGIVVNLLKLKHELINMVFSQLSAVTSTMWRQLNELNTPGMRHNIELSQGILSGLGIGHDRIEAIQRLAFTYELATKQSQAGETVFMLYDNFDDNVREFASSLGRAGFDYSHHSISFRGLETSVTRLTNAVGPP